MPAKQFTDYVICDQTRKVTLADYHSSPATAFLKYIISAKDASQQCINKFKAPKKKNYTVDALDSIYIINAGLLASIMGNFETFQKYLFAAMFDYSIYLDNFNVERCLKKIKEAAKASSSTQFEVDFVRFSAYRDNPVAVGIILADQLKNWQSPTIVNNYIRAFELKDTTGKMPDFFGTKEREELAILWQMRHSIVHTASTITLPDSQKVKGLENFGGMSISLDKQFIYEIARKLHPLIKKSVEQLGTIYMSHLKTSTPTDVKNKISKVFKVTSSCTAWLK